MRRSFGRDINDVCPWNCVCDVVVGDYFGNLRM